MQLIDENNKLLAKFRVPSQMDSRTFLINIQYQKKFQNKAQPNDQMQHFAVLCKGETTNVSLGRQGQWLHVCVGTIKKC